MYKRFIGLDREEFPYFLYAIEASKRLTCTTNLAYKDINGNVIDKLGTKIPYIFVLVLYQHTVFD